MDIIATVERVFHDAGWVNVRCMNVRESNGKPSIIIEVMDESAGRVIDGTVKQPSAYVSLRGASDTWIAAASDAVENIREMIREQDRKASEEAA